MVGHINNNSQTKLNAKDQKILITGAAGFIGSHLVEEFLKEGHSVIGVDNFVTGNPENLEQFKSNPKFTFIEHDISESLDIAEDLDWVLHFASPASPIDFEELAIPILKVGGFGTYNSLNIAKKHNAKFFLASTSEVYGDPLVHPQPEDYLGNVNPIGLRGAYDESKRFAEAMAIAFERNHATDIRIGRIFNTYGPRMRANDGRVVCTFIDQALKGQDVTVFGDGSQTRSFQYIDDLIDGIIRLMNADHHRPVNLGTTYEFTVQEIAEQIIKMTDSKSKIIYKDLPEDDPKRRRPDLTKAKKLLNWDPQTELELGLEKTIEYFKTKLLAHKN